MRRIVTPWDDRLLLLAAEGEATPREWFTGTELQEVSSFRLPKRRDEWFLSRAAAKQLACELGLCSDPRHCTVVNRRLLVGADETGWNVSISHSWPYAAAALSPEPIGVDVQVVRPFDDDAAHLFLTGPETEAMRRCSLPNRLLHFWCAKEAAWKSRFPEFATLKQVPLVLTAECNTALQFSGVSTCSTEDLILALSDKAFR